ncbi:hypothetical protein FJU08_16500 [Martelella alba]|uniref:Uncharacterized protein n=1 Tax=Martelella alba TaxID=2590451 RepID=A0A506U4Z1_9HYPH|nr:hypothetical protein [Martelella alba]TPW28920.1 hypothetical protein FJU08_16500 [Martelella alba]
MNLLRAMNTTLAMGGKRRAIERRRDSRITDFAADTWQQVCELDAVGFADGVFGLTAVLQPDDMEGHGLLREALRSNRILHFRISLPRQNGRALRYFNARVTAVARVPNDNGIGERMRFLLALASNVVADPDEEPRP